ncbi:putative reverse transcriptase domain-containing protein [Tanacetum coccineum]
MESGGAGAGGAGAGGAGAGGGGAGGGGAGGAGAGGGGAGGGGAGGGGAGGAGAGGAGAGGAGAGGAGAGGAGAGGAGVGGAGPAAPKITGCTYITFMKCDPQPFKGTKVESGILSRGNFVLEMCCKGLEARIPEQVKVEQYIRGLSKNIRGDVTSSRPTGIDEVVRMAYQLMGQIMQDKTDEASESEKRKGEGDRGGHGDNRLDYNRRNVGHRKSDCPKLKKNGQGRNNRGAVYKLGAVDAQQDPKVVTGTFLLNNRYATALFDSGADKSFVSTNFSTD